MPTVDEIVAAAKRLRPDELLRLKSTAGGTGGLPTSVPGVFEPRRVPLLARPVVPTLRKLPSRRLSLGILTPTPKFATPRADYQCPSPSPPCELAIWIGELTERNVATNPTKGSTSCRRSMRS